MLCIGQHQRCAKASRDFFKHLGRNSDVSSSLYLISTPYMELHHDEHRSVRWKGIVICWEPPSNASGGAFWVQFSSCESMREVVFTAQQSPNHLASRKHEARVTSARPRCIRGRSAVSPMTTVSR